MGCFSVYHTSPQSFITKFSYSFAQQISFIEFLMLGSSRPVIVNTDGVILFIIFGDVH